MIWIKERPLLKHHMQEVAKETDLRLAVLYLNAFLSLAISFFQFSIGFMKVKHNLNHLYLFSSINVQSYSRYLPLATRR